MLINVREISTWHAVTWTGKWVQKYRSSHSVRIIFLPSFLEECSRYILFRHILILKLRGILCMLEISYADYCTALAARSPVQLG